MEFGATVYTTILKYMFAGTGLTPGARLVIQHITPWDPELVVACMEQNALKASDMPTVTYVATGWTPAHATICKHIETMMSDILRNLTETGTYSIPGFEPNAAEPDSAQTRPELDDSTFKLSKPRYSSNAFASMGASLVRP